jgi:nucleoside-diphosphate-sugar epimerase
LDIHAEDAIQVISEVVEARDTPSGVYSEGSGTSLTAAQIVAQVEIVIARYVNVTHHPARPFDVRSICLDSGKLKRATGCSPQWSMQDGIADLQRAFGTIK